MIKYWIEHYDKFMVGLIEHLQLTVITVFISIIISLLITLLIRKYKRVQIIVNGLFSGLYSIPSLALFAMLIPFTGLGLETAVIVLVIYNQYILVRTNIAGLDQVDSHIIEAAKGMGMTDFQILYKVQFPLALPIIFGGIRLATISTISIGTIAAGLGAGGLGRLLFEGLRQMNQAKVVGGPILVIILSIGIGRIFEIIENNLKKNYGLKS